jgi:Txe/YoeB family toxin of Txe-Axe toxin-antitoxin module
MLGFLDPFFGEDPGKEEKLLLDEKKHWSRRLVDDGTLPG